jgi:ADP-ribose pyrophosphatase
MMAANYWKKTGTKTLFEHPRISIVEDEVVLPTGTHTKYLRFNGVRDYVTIIAVNEGKIAMIREYSYPHDEWLWQFPEGTIESGETAPDAVHRELLEEAGLAAGHIETLGINYDHHRRSTAKDHVYVATDITIKQKVGGDEEEHGTETHWFAPTEVRSMLREGKIVQKNTQAALSLYLAVGDGNE